jgi:hypothetical protein
MDAMLWAREVVGARSTSQEPTECFTAKDENTPLPWRANHAESILIHRALLGSGPDPLAG